MSTILRTMLYRTVLTEVSLFLLSYLFFTKFPLSRSQIRVVVIISTSQIDEPKEEIIATETIPRDQGQVIGQVPTVPHPRNDQFRVRRQVKGLVVGITTTYSNPSTVKGKKLTRVLPRDSTIPSRCRLVLPKKRGQRANGIRKLRRQ